MARKKAASAEQPLRNDTRSELWAEALASFEADTGMMDRARGIRKKHQNYYEEMGIPADEVRRRYKEGKLSEGERMKLYADEQESRRALDLWTAESPADFDKLIERAAQTTAATGAGADKLAGARAYNDGFNSARKGGASVDDNPHTYGDPEHQQWALGCKDGIDYNENLAGHPLAGVEPSPREAAPMEEAPSNRAPAPKKSARKKSSSGAPAEDVAATAEETDTATDGLFSDMPTPPGLPN
jgi:hypothetical protein